MNNQHNYTHSSSSSTNTSPQTAKYKPTPIDYKGLHFLLMGAPDPQTLSHTIEVSHLIHRILINSAFISLVKKSLRKNRENLNLPTIDTKCK